MLQIFPNLSSKKKLYKNYKAFKFYESLYNKKHPVFSQLECFWWYYKSFCNLLITMYSLLLGSMI